ncbi:PAX-interacting protein 1 isoform X3 [Achroia grisella]|uniref:PAX-interacting protein 1 isoform X3 n=1 Tax=Achroia grisella TaxID=688607 RepID=UPI0027D2AE2C|nr:PAX-interacting protein 1 isoform X3 [Achroia grisella]
MVTIVDDLDSLSLNEQIFKDVKYYLSGDVSERIMLLLQSGGAENTKYFSDYVTHLICGQNAADTDLDDAQDIYQIPAVTENWVLACIRLKKLANHKPYNPIRNKIFSNVVACVSKVSAADCKALFALITYHGGKVKLQLDSQCSHLICGSASGKKYQTALTFSSSKIKIVTPDWVLESLRARIQAVAEVFHPKLLIIPQPPPKPMDRISAITGFDFEEGIAKNEVPTQNMAENKDDSTQALLDKLKQRMPWNHPPSTANSSSIATSTVNSLGYTSTTLPTSSIMSKTIPQGIVTQNLQIQQPSSQPNAQLMQKFGQNTIVSQSPINVQSQQISLQQQQPQYSQGQQQPQQQQPHGLTAIQIQQQKMLQQHQLKMQMLQQHQQQNKIGNQPSQQGFPQPNVSVSQINQGLSGQIQHIQGTQHHIQQNVQTPNTSMSSAQQQIENISQMLSQSANSIQQQQLNQQNLAMKQNLSLSQQTASQAVQNIAQQLAQSTQSFQNAKLNQNMAQGQVITQQLIGSGQQLSNQNPNLIQQQTVQSLTNQQQNINMGVVNQQGHVTSSQGQQGQSVQLNQLVGNSGQQTVIGQQIQSVQQTIQGQQSTNVPVQGTWRQQNIQMVQNIQGQHQIIRSPMVQSRNPQNQVILQQQIMQTQQQALINNQQPQLSPQHTIQQTSQQILQQSIGSQGQPIGQTHHQILVQKQQLLNSSGQQQIVQAPQQVLINQHTGQQQILVHGNQQVTLQSGQQIVSQSQIVHQGGQIVNQGGQQIITQGNQQVLSQGGQHVITQQGQQHQVVIAQSSQQIVTQSGQQIIGQQVGQTQQVLSQLPQSPQAGSQLTSGGGIQQIITHGGGQQIVSPGGQQIVQGGQNVSWQQQQYLQQRQQIAQPGGVGPRVSWTAGGGGRQLIHLDAQTHAQLQQMDPKQRAMFVAQLQKRRQLSMQRAAALAQQQPGVVTGSPGAPTPAGAPQSVTFIRSQLPAGLTQQQQVQWLQQQGARAATIPAPAPAQPPQSPVGGAPVASPVGAGGAVQAAGAGGAAIDSQVQQLQLHRQNQYRLQQLQAQRDLFAQREHIAHHHAAVKQVQVGVGVGVAPQLVAAVLPEAAQESAGELHQGANSALVVNPKTKTALANMLNIRLQGGTPAQEHEPSAAGTLRLMTAAHAVRAPARLLLGPQHHPHQQAGGVSTGGPVGVGAGVVGNKVYAGAVRPPPPRAQFYGHNPNLKLPPDLFLLGCVFHIVEYQQSWGAERVSRWADAILRRGGEVEGSYCARVTHVLCETQKHGVVMQALRDAKRCVTAYWLSDAMVRRNVAPPWQALHLPAMYGARERPARHHRAALSGWRGDDRVRLACCVRHVGAQLTPYLTRDNTVVVCRRAEGAKYRRAREWGVPVVTAAWLTDLLLGNMSALPQIENARYQQFNLSSPFRMDYSLVSHLMNGWKMPINITQESNERAKRSAAAAGLAPRRAKKPRLEPPPAPPAPPASPAVAGAAPPPLQLAPRVLFSAVSAADHERLATIVRQLGGSVVTSPTEATHLVMEKLVRTCKLVSCLVTVKHLISTEWVLESQRINKFADEAKHELRDEAFNKMFKCDISEVLLCGEQRKRLLEGVTFFLTPCVKPSRAALIEMIELCGGKVEKNRRSYVSIQEMHNQKPFSYLVLTVPNDLHLVYYLLQSEKTLNVVCSTEVVLSAIMRQKLEVEDFLVKID